MAGLSDAAEKLFLDHAFANSPWTAPSAHYMGLFTGDPGDDGSGFASELQNGNYVRDQITFGTVASNRTQNTNPLSYDTTGVTPGTVTHWAIFDHPSLTTGYLASAPLTAPIAFTAGRQITFAIGAMAVQTSNTIFTDTLANAMLNHVLRGTPYTPAAQHYLSMHNADPGQNGTAEFANYTRQAINFNAAAAGTGTVPATAQSVTNNGAIQFTSLNSADSPLDYWGIFTAATVGTFLVRRNQTTEVISDDGTADLADAALQIGVD